MKIMKRPSVSVIMPVFNAGEWLREAILSIRNQSVKDFEFIVIDDGSTDGSGVVIADAANADKRICVVHQAHSGVAAALNKGIGLSRSQYIARMDADDVAHPERFEKQRTYLVQHPGIGALGCWAHVIDERGHKIGELKPEAEPSAVHSILTKQNPFIHASMMVSIEAIRQSGGYRAALEGAEDYDLWLRISERAQLANLPEFLMRQRCHSTSISAMASARQLLAARLARISAIQRRASKPDNIDQLTTPLDLGALDGYPEFRRTSNFFRMLTRSSDDPSAGNLLRCLRGLDLNHAERKAAQYWLKDALKSNKGYLFRAEVLFWLLLLHPPRGLSLAGSALRSRP